MGVSQTRVWVFMPSTANGLLPARRVAGMAASAASPETWSSRATGAITSIRPSMPAFFSGGGSGKASGV